MLAPLQRGLCRLYRIESGLDVRDFLIDEATRRILNTERAPREQLLILQQEDETPEAPDPGRPEPAPRQPEVHVALFIDRAVLDRLERTPRAERVLGKELAEFCLAVEGVSHFVYFVHRAQQHRTVSALELELQAEIDKYVTCILETWDLPGGPPADLRERLFQRFELEPDLSDEEHDRYLAATRDAAAYARYLDQRFVRARALPDMLAELRRLWRLGYQEKVEEIHARAA